MNTEKDTRIFILTFKYPSDEHGRNMKAKCTIDDLRKYVAHDIMKLIEDRQFYRLQFDTLEPCTLIIELE